MKQRSTVCYNCCSNSVTVASALPEAGQDVGGGEMVLGEVDLPAADTDAVEAADEALAADDQAAVAAAATLCSQREGSSLAL